MEAIPVKLITHPQPGLFGAAAAFAKEYRMTIDEIMRSAPVIPVLVLDGVDRPGELAETLVEAGLPVLEVTLRTPSALEAIKAMAAVAGAIVGAGTVLNERMLGAGDRCRRKVHRLARADRAARARRRSPAACRSCPASPPPATSCAGSTSASTGSNSSRPRQRAELRR